MPRNLLRSLLAGFSLLACFRSASASEQAIDSIAKAKDKSSIIAATYILDHFMRAGRRDDPESGAKLLALYEQYEPRAYFHTEALYRKRPKLFKKYRSISNDLYGYEIKPSLLGTRISMEGRVETDEGFSDEFSAELVYYGMRWHITKIYFD